MYKRVCAALLLGFVVTVPAMAGELKPQEARRFIAGKLFAFNCFEGTRGSGRIQADGSVSGTVQFRGEGPVRYVSLPAGTLQVGSDAVCASVKGMPFQPCFNIEQTDKASFRGSISGLGFAYCDFNRRSGRVNFANARSRPLPLQSAATTASASARDE